MAAIDTVSELASFERRGAGTDAERRAAQFLAARLTNGNRTAELETFWCRPNWALAHAWHVALAIAGSLVSTSAPHVGVVLLMVALLSIVADAVTGHSPGRRLTPERASQNVVATSPRNDRPATLILTANYDAGRTGLVFQPWARGAAAALSRAMGPLALGWLAWLCVAIVWILAAAAIRATGHDTAAVSAIQVPPTVGLVLALALLLETAASAPGPAANDNASGTAVALALARALDAAPPPHLAVEVVVQGAGDGGGIGFRRHRSRQRHERRPSNTVVIGLGPSGAGAPRWWRSDGPLFPLRYSPRLDELCAGVAAQHPSLHAARHRGRGAGPGYPARQRRLPAVSIGCLDGRGLAPGSHLPSDEPQSLDTGALDRTTQFALIVIDAIDAFFAGRLTERTEPEAATPA